MSASQAVAMCATKPVMWEKGAAASRMSSRPKRNQTLNTSALKQTLPCVLHAAFGFPVVPDV
jgi:hypothetical protein